MHQPIMPDSMPRPAARYAHATLVTNPARWLHTAGQVGIDADGNVPDGVAAQAKVIWHNIAALLAAADMSADDIVSITTYVVASAMEDGLAEAMAERDTFMSGRLVASTLLTVPALVRPEWLIEIVVVAADQKAA
ncbi:RidA family protein [Dactylosporangium sp. NPDC000244]|uniref:RidA family protein n=1 Tax=Dactylosporangium sp. NPDC000244 TaxID=3154365 RepID=UPI0033336382|nr:RidA family protein [Dactylosporangium thailandense]